MPRSEAVQMLSAYGGIYVSSVTRTTDYLVVGTLRKKTSRKLTAANRPVSSKIQLLTPFDFYLSIGLII